MKQTLKIAELATFIYAFLFFGALLINMAYYNVFGINIIAYSELSEILLLFFSSPSQIIVTVIIIILGLKRTEIFIHNNQAHIRASIIRKKIRFFNSISLFFLYVILLLIYIFLDIKLYGLEFVLLFYLILAPFSIFFDNEVLSIIRYAITQNNEIVAAYRKLVSNTKKVFLGDKTKSTKGIKAIKRLDLQYRIYYTPTTISKIASRKNIIRKYRIIYQYRSLYYIIYLYCLSIIGGVIVSSSLAYAYISNEQRPNQNIYLKTINNIINTDKDEYIYIGENIKPVGGIKGIKLL